VQYCGSWTWNPNTYEYDARWTAGSIGRIVLVDFGSARIFFHRLDFAGATESAHAIYVGKWSGDHVDAAQEEASINDKSLGPMELAWSATSTDQSGLSETERVVPKTMTVCVFDKQPCRVWRFEGRIGRTTSPAGRQEDLLIDRFDAQDVAFHGLDISREFLLDTVYIGHRHGNEIDGDVTWTWNHGASKSAVGKWYATIETSPDPPPQTVDVAKLHGVVCKELDFGFAPITTTVLPIGGVSCTPHPTVSDNKGSLTSKLASTKKVASTSAKATPRPSVSTSQSVPLAGATLSPTASSQLQAAEARINAMAASGQITSAQASQLRKVLSTVAATAIHPPGYVVHVNAAPKETPRPDDLIDPNFAWPSGTAETGDENVHTTLSWSYVRAAEDGSRTQFLDVRIDFRAPNGAEMCLDGGGHYIVLTNTYVGGGEYLGFDAKGSYFESCNGVIWRWDGKAATVYANKGEQESDVRATKALLPHDINYELAPNRGLYQHN
jgi:hypothetical protein